MALNVCAGCTTKFAVGLKRCPHCGSTDYCEDGQDMPKITVHGGASNADASPSAPVSEPGPKLELPHGGATIATSGAWEDEPELDDAEAETETSEEESSPGSSSSPSSETPPTEPEKSKPARRKPARKMASPSKPDPTDASSAPMTVGGPTEATSAADDTNE